MNQQNAEFSFQFYTYIYFKYVSYKPRKSESDSES